MVTAIGTAYKTEAGKDLLLSTSALRVFFSVCIVKIGKRPVYFSSVWGVWMVVALVFVFGV